MITMSGFEKLYEYYQSSDMPENEWIYMKPDAKRKTIQELFDSEYYFLDEEEEEAMDSLPPEKQLRSFLETATFDDVISVRKRGKENASIEDLAEACLYYLEMDTFLE